MGRLNSSLDGVRTEAARLADRRCDVDKLGVADDDRRRAGHPYGAARMLVVGMIRMKSGEQSLAKWGPVFLHTTLPAYVGTGVYEDGVVNRGVDRPVLSQQVEQPLGGVVLLSIIVAGKVAHCSYQSDTTRTYECT